MPPELNATAAPTLEAQALCSATLRALVGDPTLQWSGQNLYQGQAVVPLYAPHLQLDGLPQSALRAISDSAALRLRYSEGTVHERQRPEEPVARMVFELLEQLRVESLAPACYQGLVGNVHDHFRQWTDHFIDSGLTETAVGLLVFTIAVTAWSRLNSLSPSDACADLMESTRANIMPTLGGAFAQLRQHCADQQRYGAAARDIALWVGAAVAAQQGDAPVAAARARRKGFALPLHFSTPPLDAFDQAATGASPAWEATRHQYRVFSRQFDRELPAAQLVRAAQLVEFREAMDLDTERADLNLPRLVRSLRQGLSRPVDDGWSFEQEEGLLDARLLPQLVASPQQRHVFMVPARQPAADCAVTLLLDCSGSMKNHMLHTSLLADVLARSLDMAGVRTEVLGFTTGGWNGGRVRRHWLRAGSPSYPGRLNEQMHLVFKSATVAWKRARRAMAALRKPDIYKEGVDGEALEWASQRLMALPARRRILLVISDGCPMDTATHAANDPNYLDQHLQSVLRQLQAQGQVEVCALGVGLDLGVFYHHRLALNLDDGLHDALLQDIAALLCRPKLRVRA